MNSTTIFKNYPLITDSYDKDDIIKQIGGADEQAKPINDEPNGGFPPIYICDQESQTEESKETEKREFKTHKQTISIKTIMENRRKKLPFTK